MKRLKLMIAAILPGIFLMGYNIGTGSVTAMSKAGANFGNMLLWTVLLSCIITYYLIVHFSKYTMVTGETAIEGIKKHIHPAVAFVLIIILSGIILAALVGLLGLLGDVMHVWSKTWVDRGLPASWFCAAISILLYGLLWVGKTTFFEKVLAVLVAIMGFTFLLTMIISMPTISEIAQGFIPRIPEKAPGSDNGPMIILASMVGTTVSVFAFIIRTILVKEAGWTIKDMKAQKHDARISVLLMFIISAAVMITAAATLHGAGQKMNSIAEMIQMLEPFFDRAALGVFVFGILAAGISSHLPNLLVIPWLAMDFRGKGRDMRSTGARLTLGVLSIFAAVFAAMGFESVYVMLISQACLAIILPFVVGCLLYLTSNRKIMGQYRNNTFEIITLVLILIFTVYMCWIGTQGLIIELRKFISYFMALPRI